MMDIYSRKFNTQKVLHFMHAQSSSLNTMLAEKSYKIKLIKMWEFIKEVYKNQPLLLESKIKNTISDNGYLKCGKRYFEWDERYLRSDNRYVRVDILENHIQYLSYENNSERSTIVSLLLLESILDFLKEHNTIRTQEIVIIYLECISNVKVHAALKKDGGNDPILDKHPSSCELQKNGGGMPPSSSAVILCSPHVAGGRASALVDGVVDEFADFTYDGLTNDTPDRLTIAAFDGLTNVTSVGLTNVTSVELPNVTSVGLNNVTSVGLNNVTSVGLTNVTSVGLNNVTSVGLTNVTSVGLKDVLTDVDTNYLIDVDTNWLTDDQTNWLTDDQTNWLTDELADSLTSDTKVEPCHEKPATHTPQSATTMVNETQMTSINERLQIYKFIYEFTVMDLQSAFSKLNAESICGLQEDNINDDLIFCFLQNNKSCANIQKELLNVQIRECNTGKNVGLDFTQSNTIFKNKAANLPVSDSNSYRNLYQNVPNNPELDLKFNPDIHFQWRHELLAFPFQQSSSHIITESVRLQNNLYCFMKFEVFRMCSFNFLEFPTDSAALVSNLAKNGLYYARPEVVCFDCGNKSTDFRATFLDNFHKPECTRNVSNVPISQLMHGLNLEDLADYYVQYNSLTPFLSEFPQYPASHLKIADNAATSASNSATHSESQTFCSSSGYLSGASFSTLREMECSDGAEIIKSHPDTENLSKDVNSASQKYLIEDHLHSLPSNQNHQMQTSIARSSVNFTESDLLHQAVPLDENDTASGATTHSNPSLDLSNASYTSFANKDVRLQTFQTWNHTHQPDALAANGFFYTGQAGCVRCFYCGLELKLLKPTDIPSYLHAKYRPNCLYIRKYNGQAYVDRVQQDILREQEAANTATPTDLQRQSNQAVTQDSGNTGRQSNQAVTEDSGNPGGQSNQAVIQGAGNTAPVLKNYMDSEAAYEALRSGWSMDQIQTAVKYITQVFGDSCLDVDLLSDILRNFNMPDNPDGSRTNDSFTNTNESSSDMPDNPDESRTNDSFTNTNESGSDMADAAMLSAVQDPSIPVFAVANKTYMEQAPERMNPLTEATEVQQPTAANFSFSEILRSVEREHSLLVERTTCRVCRSKPISSIYLPCGHVIACQDCAELATRCLLCQRQIIGTANVFLA